MANALLQSISIARGEDVSLQFAVTPTPTDGQPRQYGFQVKAKSNAEASDPALVDAAGTYDPGTGVVTVSLSHATTAALSVGTYFYWLWRTDSGSQKESAAGQLTVVAGGRY